MKFTNTYDLRMFISFDNYPSDFNIRSGKQKGYLTFSFNMKVSVRTFVLYTFP